jgi:hypothetical protein
MVELAVVVDTFADVVVSATGRVDVESVAPEVVSDDDPPHATTMTKTDRSPARRLRTQFLPQMAADCNQRSQLVMTLRRLGWLWSIGRGNSTT